MHADMGTDIDVRPFGIGQVQEAERVAEAWSNQVFRVRTNDGTFAVKVFPARVRRADLRPGMAVEAAALATGPVPMARPVPGPSGSWSAEVETPEGVRLARCHQWIEGRPASTLSPTSARVDDVARSLAVIHGLGLPNGDTSRLVPLDLARWHRAVDGAERAGLSWSGELAALTPLVHELAARLDELRAAHRPMIASHGDLDPKNAVVRPDGRIALTDWDYAGPVLPGVELVVAATSFAGDPPAPELVAAFVAAYREAGGRADPPDALALVAEASDTDWLLRNVEGCLADGPADEVALRHRLAPELVRSFAGGVSELEAWAEQVRL